MVKKVWKFFCSVKLTVILFILILIPSIIGTIILQNAESPTKYLETYGPTWDAIFRFFGFYDVYHDSRFIILLVLLALNSFACTINRLRFQWNRLGTMMTHFGLLFILVGALIGAIWGEKGFMEIREGQTTDQMSVGQTNTAMATVPFKVKLVDFVLEKEEKPEFHLLVLDVKTNKKQSYTLGGGETLQLPRSRWAKFDTLLGLPSHPSGSIKIEKLIPNAAMVSTVSEGPEKTGVSAMEFRLIGKDKEERQFVLSKLENPLVFGQAQLGVGYLKVGDKRAVDEALNKALSLYGANNQIEITLPETGAKKTYPATVGSKFKVEGTKYSVEVLRYEPDFVISGREFTSRSALPNNPAIQLRITGPSGAREQWFFSKFPTMHTPGDMPFELVFKMNPHLSNMADFVLVLNPSDGSQPVLAGIHEGKLVSRRNVELGKSANIENTEYKIVINKFIENANIISKLEERPDLPGKPALEISVKHGGSPTPYYLPEETPVDVPGYRVMYMGAENRIKDYISNLQVFNGGNMVAEKKIRVNDPLHYGGYTLYQSSYREEDDLSWTVLEVKKDPGVSFVYTGFSVLIVGMTIIFYINPLLRRTKKA